MADLDDFFAKKDKKRSKKKYTTPDELVKKLEEKPVEKPKKERPAEQEGEVNQPEEDEWKDIEEEQTRDYTGLKIGQLQIGDEENEGYVNDGEGSNVDGENNAQSGSSTVWKKSGSGSEQTSSAAAVATTPVNKEPVSKTYVIPQMQKMNRLRKGVAPDISSEEYFPSLGAERPEPKANKKGFEEIKHGARPQKQVGNAPLAVENRFNTLSDAS